MYTFGPSVRSEGPYFDRSLTSDLDAWDVSVFGGGGGYSYSISDFTATASGATFNFTYPETYTPNPPTLPQFAFVTLELPMLRAVSTDYEVELVCSWDVPTSTVQLEAADASGDNYFALRVEYLGDGNNATVGDMDLTLEEYDPTFDTNRYGNLVLDGAQKAGGVEHTIRVQSLQDRMRVYWDGVELSIPDLVVGKAAAPTAIDRVRVRFWGSATTTLSPSGVNQVYVKSIRVIPLPQ